MGWLPDSLDEVVESHAKYLQVRHKDHFKGFRHRAKQNPDAARSEAVVFSWLRGRLMNPEPNELPSKGGCDFLCSGSQLPQPLIVEVTSLSREAIGLKSGLADEVSVRAQHFSMITPQLFRKAQGKARQLADEPCARVLAICSLHARTSLLLGVHAAESLLTSDPSFRVTSDGREGAGVVVNVTRLENSAFIQRDGAGHVIPVRQSISAILLFDISGTGLSAVGLLHPEPAVPLEYRVFSGVPFVRLSSWPVTNELVTEWVTGSPPPAQWRLRKIMFTEGELREESRA